MNVNENASDQRVSPTPFLHAFDSATPSEVDLPNGSYVMLRSATVPHHRYMPTGCSEACTVHFMPHMDREALAKLHDAQVPVAIVSQVLSANGGSLLAANSWTTSTGITTVATTALLAWGHANGMAARLANTDELGQTLRKANEAMSRIPFSEQVDTQRGAVLIAASTLRFGGEPQRYSDFCAQCVIADPHRGLEAAIGKLDDMLSLEHPCQLKDRAAEVAGHVSGETDVPRELQLFATAFSQDDALAMRASAAVPANKAIVTELVALGEKAPSPAAAVSLSRRLAGVVQETRLWMEQQIRVDEDWRHRNQERELTAVFRNSLVRGMEEDKRSGIFPPACDPNWFFEQSSLVHDLLDGCQAEWSQLSAIDLSLSSRGGLDVRRRATDAQRPPLFQTAKIPALAGNEHFENNPLRALLACMGPGSIVALLESAHPRRGDPSLKAELAETMEESSANAGLGLTSKQQHHEMKGESADSPLRAIAATQSVGYGLWNVLRTKLEDMGAILTHGVTPSTLAPTKDEATKQGRSR